MNIFKKSFIIPVMLCSTFTFNPSCLTQKGPKWDLNPGPSCCEVTKTQTIKTLSNNVVLRLCWPKKSIHSFHKSGSIVPRNSRETRSHDCLYTNQFAFVTAFSNFVIMSGEKKEKPQHFQQRWLSLGFKARAKSSFVLLDVLGKYFICLILNWPLVITFW